MRIISEIFSWWWLWCIFFFTKFICRSFSWFFFCLGGQATQKKESAADDGYKRVSITCLWNPRVLDDSVNIYAGPIVRWQMNLRWSLPGFHQSIKMLHYEICHYVFVISCNMFGIIWIKGTLPPSLPPITKKSASKIFWSGFKQIYERECKQGVVCHAVANLH